MIDAAMIVTLIFGFFVVAGLLSGFRKGFGKQVLQIICSVAAIAGAAFVTKYISENILVQIRPEHIISSLESVSAQVTQLNAVVPYLSSWDWFMQLSFSSVLAPVVFTVAFGILWLLSKIVYFILGFILGLNKPGIIGRVLGAALGLVEGLLIAFIMFVPVSGLSNIANGGIDTIREKNTDGQYTGIIEFYDDNISPVTNHKIVEFVGKNGGQMILNKFAVIDVDGKKVNLIDEGTTVLSMCLEAVGLKGVDFAAPSAEHQAIIRSIVDELDESEYLSATISHMFSDLGGALNGGALPVAVPAPFDVILLPAISVFETSRRDNLHGDLVTVLDVYFLLTDSGTIKAFASEGGENTMQNALTQRDENGKTLISKVIEILNKNERTSALVKTLTDMTITMMAGQLGGGEFDVEAVYTEIKTGFNDVLAVNREDYTPEEYEAARDAKINSTLVENGIQLDEATVNELGNYIDENLGDKDELTDEDINNILLHYYEVVASGEVNLPVVPEVQ